MPTPEVEEIPGENFPKSVFSWAPPGMEPTLDFLKISRELVGSGPSYPKAFNNHTNQNPTACTDYGCEKNLPPGPLSRQPYCNGPTSLLLLRGAKNR